MDLSTLLNEYANTLQSLYFEFASFKPEWSQSDTKVYPGYVMDINEFITLCKQKEIIPVRKKK